MTSELNPAQLPTIRDLVTRVGVADVYAFGLTWKDRESFFPNSAIPHKSEFRQIVSCSTR